MAFGFFFIFFLEISCSSFVFLTGLLFQLYDFFYPKNYYECYKGDLIEEICPICLEDFNEQTSPVILKNCTKDNNPKHFFHKQCILKHSEYSERCPVCRVIFSRNITRTNRFNLNRFEYEIRRLEPP